jgi:hypothetical protein
VPWPSCMPPTTSDSLSDASFDGPLSAKQVQSPAMDLGWFGYLMLSFGYFA